MKKITILLAAMLLGTGAVMAQKFGRIDYPGVVQAMPEMATVQTDLQKVQADYEEHLEGLEVELNKKIQDFQSLPTETSQTSRDLKTREIQEMQTRLQEYLQVAQEGLQTSQAEMMQPLSQKADAAIAKVAKAQGITVVFQNDTMVYLDEASVVDITAAVKKELGIAL